MTIRGSEGNVTGFTMVIRPLGPAIERQLEALGNAFILALRIPAIRVFGYHDRLLPLPLMQVRGTFRQCRLGLTMLASVAEQRAPAIENRVA